MAPKLPRVTEITVALEKPTARLSKALSTRPPSMGKMGSRLKIKSPRLEIMSIFK